MIDFFKSIKTDDKSLLITTHMLEVAYELADDIVVFKDHQLEKISNDFESFQSFKTYVLEALKTNTIPNDPK